MSSRSVRPVVFRVIVVAAVAGMIAGCCLFHRKSPIARPIVTDFHPNRPPTIRGFVLERDGARVRHAARGSSTTIRVIARDPEDGRLRFHWSASSAAATVELLADGSARWSVPADDVDSALRVRVEDPLGAIAERTLHARESADIAVGGRIVAANGDPVHGAVVRLGGLTTQSDRDGRFTLRLPDSGQRRFVLDIAHPDHAPISSVFGEPVSAGRWVLAPATTTAVDFTRQATVAVAPPASCPGTLSSRVDWGRHTKQRVGVATANDRAYTAALSSSLETALEWVESPANCPGGFSITFRANSMVAAGTSSPVASGQVSLAQAQVAAPAAMPGDYTVRVIGPVARQFVTRSMQSFGAASVVATSGRRALELAPGERAAVSFPVDRYIVGDAKDLPTEVPLLRYDEPSGVWVPAGMARLDAAGTAWTGEVDHLSTLNLDLVKVDQSCVRIDASQLADASIELEVTVPQDPLAPQVRTVTLDLATTPLHALYNLPSNIWIALRPFRVGADGTPSPLGTFIVNTGAPQEPTDPNQPEFPYVACKSQIDLADLGASVEIVNQDDDSTRSGLLVPVYYGLVHPTTNDLYPPGAGDVVPIGIYDTGSSSIPISDAMVPNAWTNELMSDADRLGIGTTTTVKLRVSALDQLAPDGDPAMGPPGAPDVAGAELASVNVRPTTPDLTLIGAPFHTAFIAHIDYATEVTSPQSTRVGARARFFGAGSPGIPIADVEAPLRRFGPVTPTGPGGYSWGQRFLLDGLTLRNGSASVGPSGPNPAPQVLYDSGTTWFTVSMTLGGLLGLAANDYRGPCFDDGDLFRIDRVELAGAGGRYVVTDLLVCRRPDMALAQIAASERADAIVGSNMFRRTEIVVDGPGNTLGVIRPIP